MPAQGVQAAFAMSESPGAWPAAILTSSSSAMPRTPGTRRTAFSIACFSA
jgi:hypothetical protein